jgi:hypothetical protein
MKKIYTKPVIEIVRPRLNDLMYRNGGYGFQGSNGGNTTHIGAKENSDYFEDEEDDAEDNNTNIWGE